MNISTLVLQWFRGRADRIAAANGDAFKPEVGMISELRLQKHLDQKEPCGFYLMTPDSHVFCSCVDIDNHEGENPNWKNDAETLAMVLDGLDIPHLTEVSQSGEGAHIWIFFAEPTEAWIPRAFFRAAASKYGVRIKEIYPRQDRIAADGIGNLVRYPLWNKSRFVNAGDWSDLDPVEALTQLRATNGTDLRTVAFHSGMGNLVADPRFEAAQVEGGTDMIPAFVARLLDSGSTLLFRRWNNDTAGMGADKSRSSVAMSLCCELVRLYASTPEIASTLKAWCSKHAYDEKGNRDDWINRTVANAYRFVRERREKKSDSITTLKDAAHAYIDTIELESEMYVPSGLKELDDRVGGGVARGEVAIVAGRPSHGKSAFAFQWMSHAGSMGIKGLIISEEMGKLQIGKRRLMSITGLPHEQWVAASAAVLRRDVDDYHKGHADVYVVESCSTIDRVEEVVDQFCSMHEVGIVAIDYLQLLGSRSTERYEVVTECSRRIKQCAVRNNVPILLLSQLNRGIEGRDDHEPKLSDLRESGQIEQDADKVFFTVFPSRFSDVSEDLYYVYCGKNRNGPGANERIDTTFNPKKQIIGFEGLPDSIRDI